MKRYLSSAISKDLGNKIILISGPRQVGKTTLAKKLNPDHDYLNWDVDTHRTMIIQKSWDRKKPLLILDELHKKKDFKAYLKGIYDAEGANNPAIVVTGSARMDIIKRVGDSLAGRYFPFHLFPLDLWELGESDKIEKAYNLLCTCSGFPEPFLKGEHSYYNRWAQTHTDIILKQDVLDLSDIRNISQLGTLIQLLRSRVGSTVSVRSLAIDLQVDSKTVKNWLEMLENLFIIFKVSPFHQNIARSILKESKYYFFDCAKVLGPEGTVLENLMALSLKKQLSYLRDVKGIEGDLNFLRTKDGHEIDFFIPFRENTDILLESKLSDANLSPNFKRFEKYFPGAKKIQLVKNLKREQSFASGAEIRSALPWLTQMNFWD